jgi:nucleotide-binding universal stress UspA family protein
MAPTHVLVPLDGSPLSDEALSHALETFDCRVTVLNVVTPLDASMSESGVLDDAAESRVADARERADRLVADAADRAAGSGRSVDTVVEVGDPAAVVVEYAETHDVDHVVLGGHGGPRRPVTRRLLGTVATDVVGEAPVTVTVVR